MSQQNDRFCYIRRNNGQGWTRGSPHHEQALHSFLNTPYNLNNPAPVEVSVPHGDGGNFVAHFSRFSRANDDDVKVQTQNTLCYYVDEYDQNVDIMICVPAYAAYINRIVG